MNAKSKVVDSHDPCHDLRTALLTASPAKFERLAGCLLGRLLGIPFKIARSGDQRGGDGGVSGAGGRHLIFEARRYGDNSRLDERGIVGEIEQAVERNPALEAWILVTTREVPEQIQDAMVRAGFRHGIDTVIIDWFPQSLPKLAVLCACYPGCFEAEIGKGHGHLLESITAKQDYDAALKAIRSELDSWVIGYEAVRQASHAWVQEIWQSPRKASAMFGQDVAGGDEAAHHVRRPALIDRLDAWLEVATTGHPGALVGPDGVGKTWIAVDWLQSRLDRLPIIVMVPSSTIGNAIASRSDLIMFIARYLHEIMPVRNEPFWEQRVRRLLERPADEGSTFLLFFDGLNQRVSFDWPEVFRKLQDEPFYQRTLTLMSARTSFFEDRLHGCRALVDEPQRIDVGGYDLSPGGTFDQKLALAGLSRDNFPSHLVNLAAVPRLFDLVVQLRDDLGDASEVTVHRLLWEYGASTIVTSTDGAFSRNDWRLFILELAEGHQGGNRNYTVRRVTDLSDDATLTRDQIYQRISSVVDSIFAKLTGHGKLDFHPDFVHHALGLALVNQMEQTESDEDSRNRLEQFLDPIEGYDDHAEILRAAVTITLQKDIYPQPTWLSTLCTFWIHTQNLPDSHLIEMAILAPKLIEPLLDVIEASDGHALSTSRYIAINALDQVDKSDQLIASNIAQRGVRWLSFISLEKREPDADREENSLYAMRCKWLRERIGVTEVGEVIIAGRAFEIVNHKGDDLIIAVAQLLQGRPLQGAIEFFEVGAIHTAVVEGGKVQETQTWLNILNIIDPEDTASGLRHASDRIRSRAPEPGVHSDLNKRIASLLLWQTGYVNDARMAWANDPKIDLWHRYEKDYLPDPSRSIFPLERRHTAQVLRDTDLPVIRRIERARDALLDPSFDIPSEFIDELLSTANSFEFTRTATGRMRTGEDHDWDLLSQALARCAPDKLADLERARLRQYAERPEEHRFGSALTARHAMLLVGKDESAALQTLRERGNNGSNDDENTILTYMLITEIQCEPPTAQFRRIMETGIDRIDLLLAQACDPPSERELDYLLDEYGDDEEQLSKLASLLTVHDLKLSEQAFLALSKLLKPGEADAGLAGVWILLALNDSDRLGAMLDKTGWTWSSDKSYTENLMGSIAIAASNRGRTFIEYASRIAPAKLLEILSQKECSRADVELAVNLLDGALFGYSGDTPEPGVEISQEQNSAQFEWYEFTAGDLVEDGDNQIDVLRFFGRVNSPELREKNGTRSFRPTETRSEKRDVWEINSISRILQRKISNPF